MSDSFSPSTEFQPCYKYIGALIFLLMYNCGVLPMFLYYSYRFYKIYKTQSKCILMFLITINLCVIFRIAQVLNQIRFNVQQIYEGDHCSNFTQPICTGGILSYLPLIFLICAIIFSIFNWVYQSQAINEYLHGTSTCVKRLTFLSLVFSICIIICFFIGVVTTSCFIFKKQNAEGDNFNHEIIKAYEIFYLFVTAGFFIVSTVYIIVGRCYYVSLRRFSGVKAKEMKNRVLYSVLFISIPLYLRGIENIFRKYVLKWKFVSKSLEINDFRYPIFIILFNILTDLLPIIAMMIGLKIVINHYYQNMILEAFKPSTNRTLSRSTLRKNPSYTSRGGSEDSVSPVTPGNPDISYNSFRPYGFEDFNSSKDVGAENRLYHKFIDDSSPNDTVFSSCRYK
ncbi:unnamed protein product [Moneuplotes crassus]|uniref:Uncharacterized protein n=1 Tax=Euplotes crassus TaxID=5936 RepID=A0AAD1XEL1_EUPCR|nr:unnamed protein product [Moneuplotes crassus]